MSLPLSVQTKGARVAYSARFLRSIGAYTGVLPFARGRVADVSDSGIVTVDWENDFANEVPKRILASNLVLVSDFAKEPR